LIEQSIRWGRIHVTVVDPYPDGVVQRLKSRFGKQVIVDVQPIGFADYAKKLGRPRRNRQN
jgi:hypothetical protein